VKDLSLTLNRIDKEIIGHNQLIARSRVEIQRLTETRAVLMGIAEDDANAVDERRAVRQGVIEGEHSRPVLVVRKIGSEELAERSAQVQEPGLNKSGDRRGMNNPKGAKFGGKPPKNGKGRHSKVTAVGLMRDKVVMVLGDAEEPMSGTEIGNYLGLAAGTNEPRKALQNALYSMRVRGELHRDPEHRYSMPRLSQPNGGAHQ